MTENRTGNTRVAHVHTKFTRYNRYFLSHGGKGIRVYAVHFMLTYTDNPKFKHGCRQRLTTMQETDTERTIGIPPKIL